MEKLVSVVIPIYNEEENIPLIYRALTQVFSSIKKQYNYQLIFVNDGSKDTSWDLISNLSDKDSSVVGIKFSRNFGYQMALTAGHDYAQGNAVITIDADFQDPPELILKMIKEWEKGFYIVYAKRIARNDGFLKDTTATLYYKLLSIVADVAIPRNVGDFRLLDKKVVQEIKKCREISRYWRGLVAWTGFKSTTIAFKRPERFAGETGYTWRKLIKLAFDGLTSFSLFPLEIAAYIGVFVCGTGTFMLLYIIRDAYFNYAYYPLFKWLCVFIYIAMGVQFLLFWLLGKYIGDVYFRQKRRPLYIIEEQRGVDSFFKKRACMKKKISIVIPVYNEQETLFQLFHQLQEALIALKNDYEYEVIFVNDGSKDASWNIICGFTKKYSWVKGLSFSLVTLVIKWL